MDYKPNYYSNRNAVDKSNRYKKKRIFWLNTSFNSDFVLIDNKIYEISWDIPPFEIYKNNRLKLLTYIRDSHQSKPIQIKLKLPLTQSRNIINTDKEAFPIIYTNHSAVEAMTYGSNPIIRLIPQQITRFTFRLDDNYNQLDYNYYFSSITNGSVFQVAGGNPDDKYIIFNSSGSFVLDKNLICDILVVAGGGGGGGDIGGGGGAGGVVYQKWVNLSSGNYTITVGAGGSGSASTAAGINNNSIGGIGGDSKIQFSGVDLTFNNITFTSKGGGGGGYYGYDTGSSVAGTNGGSGGGGSYQLTGSAGGTKTQGNTYFNGNTNITGGNNGAAGYRVAGFNSFNGGGGGGAGSIGDAKNGGSGVQIDITGVNQWYAAGGGAGVINDGTIIGGRGGNGIGGDGNYTVYNGGITENILEVKHSGTNGTGSGGGGGGYNYQYQLNGGGAGGSGVVIIRFKEIRNEGITAEENLIQATNNSITVNTDSKYVINYQNSVNIPKGTYQSIFANGAITFKSKPDYNYPITSKAPLLWYKFDGSQFLYNSGTEPLHLTNNGNVVYDTSIYKKGIGSAFFQDISNQYLSGSGISISNISFSISFWAYPMNSSRGCLILFGSTSVNQGFYVAYGLDGYYTNQWLASIIGVGNIFSGTVNDLNTWVHIVYTVNSSTKNRILYRNGVKVAEETFANNMTTTSTNYTLSYIDASFSRTNGKIDDFRFYDYVLSPVEIYDLYNGNTDRSYPILKDANNATINPFVWYQFDTSGNLGSDSMGIHNLTNPNGVAFSNDYIKGNGSASFDGVNDHLIKDSAFNLNSKNFSITFWIKKTDNARIDRLFQLGTGLAANTSMYLLYGNDNKIVFGNYAQDLVSASAYTDAGNWVYLCFTYLTGTKTAIIYRNGVNVAQMNFTNEFNTNNDIRIGSFSGSGFYKGLMDDFRIYESVLTATQVSELYNGRISIYNPPAFLTGFELEDEDLFKENTISSYK